MKTEILKVGGRKYAAPLFPVRHKYGKYHVIKADRDWQDIGGSR